MLFSKNILLTTLIALTSYAEAEDYTKYVNPLIGTPQTGHVFPGASVPFGMAKPGPEMYSGDGNFQGGFNPDLKKILGFSQTHDDGTGGGGSLGNFPIFPMDGGKKCKDSSDLSTCPYDKDSRETGYHDDFSATAGYFEITLDSDIHTELTSTRRTALHKYNFPKDTKDPVLNIEIIDEARARNSGGITISKDKQQVTGEGNFNPSFGKGNYTLYFCADFKGAKISETAIYDSDKVDTDKTKSNIVDKTQSDDDDDSTGTAKPFGALLQFESDDDEPTIEARVGLSFMSREQACSNSREEADNWDFDQTVKDSQEWWNDYLGRIEVESSKEDSYDQSSENDNDKVLFYSSLYRTYLGPQNYTDENPLWKSDAPSYSSFYCIWDTFRTSYPLLGISAPDAEIEMIESLIDIYDHDGYLPDCRMTHNKGFTQGGSNADNVLSDAYSKGIGKDSVDWEKAYKAMVKDAEVEPADWDIEGRGGLDSWKKLNYIPYLDNDTKGKGLKTRSASRTVEYAYNDFGLSLVAAGLGKSDDCKKYQERSTYWENLWNKDIESKGHKGFIQPRFANGSWHYVDPRFCSPALNHTSCYLNENGGEFYEAASWTYSLLAAHDYAKLIDMIGGKDEVAKRLDTFFHSNFQDVGDEIGWMCMYLAHYIGKPHIVADRIREFIPDVFNSTIRGLPDNDDSGAMGAFVVFNMIGVYPNAGQDIYLITSPFFSDVSLKHPETGNVARISAPKLSAQNKYIQSAKLNGKEYTKAYLTHSFFTDGGHLELEMGSEQNSDWGSKELPPSLSEGDFKC